MEKEKTVDLNLLCAAQVNPEEATPMMRQFLEVKQTYPGIVLLYRMGDFYETFFEDAVIVARALEITLTSREAGKLGRVPMAGVPAKAIDGYLQKLLEKNFKVAICDQVEDPAEAKGLVDRRVTRILSSGTIADQRFLKSHENNFLVSCWFHPKEKRWGLAYCDVTTGQFYATQLTWEQLLNELDRIHPSELLVQGRRQKGVVVDEWVPEVPPQIQNQYQCTALKPEAFDERAGRERLFRWFKIQDLESFGLKDQGIAVSAIGTILGYLEGTYLEESRPVFETIQSYRLSQHLELNATARRHLELTQTVREGKQDGSLLWILDQTVTSMGGRLIRHWLQCPAIEIPEIESRLDAVEVLVQDPVLRESLREILAGIYDLERLSMKLQNLSANPRDLVALKRSCQMLPEVASLLEGQTAFYLALVQNMPPALQEFVKQVDEALLENPALSPKEGALFQTGYHAELDHLRHVLETQQSWMEAYENAERERTGIKTLKLGMNSAFGYYIEISKTLAKQAPLEYQRKQTLTNAERYITPELKAHEEEVFDAQARLQDLEFHLFLSLREDLSAYGPILRDVAKRIAMLDVLQSFATVASENRYVRPVVDDSFEITLHEARHPVIEKLLPLGAFVSNDCTLSAAPKDHRIPQVMIITGPNMAGKSTYMRQVALVVLMAQMGCFVPATYARIGLVDQMFTRIGAVDDLGSGQSTFMVEMTETAQILNCATQRSLVLLDEVGRGTSTYDGVSIAWSVAEYLTHHNGCRTLFATHYHELNTLEKVSPKIHNYRVLVSESEGEIEFLHTVAPGAAQKSYGIQVAKMAGLPQRVIQKAERLMNKMQEKEFTAIEKQRQVSLLEAARQDQLSLFPEATPVS